MKAIVQDRFGPPEVLRLADTGVPEVGAGDVLVRVAGIDAAGVVEAAGANVRGLRHGDQVLGFSGARTPSRSRRRWAPRSPGCAARTTSR